MIKNNKDAEALIAFAVHNNRKDTLSALRAYGYVIDENISDADLFTTIRNIWAEEGIVRVAEILKSVPFDMSKITQEQARNLAIKYKDAEPAPNERGEWWGKFFTNVGDFFSGNTQISQNPNITQQTSTACLSPIWVAIIVILGIIAMIWMNKKKIENAKTFSIVIAVILVGVLLYGALCKNITVTQTGGGGSQTVHNGAFGWLKGILDGLNVSVIGG